MVSRLRSCAPSPAALREDNGLVHGMCRRDSMVLVDKCGSSSITVRTVIVFVSIVDVRHRPPFFSQSGALIRFFENVECLLCIVDSTIH